MDLLHLSKKNEERENKIKVDNALKKAEEIFEDFKKDNLMVEDAMLIIKMLNDIIQSKSGRRIQKTALSDL